MERGLRALEDAADPHAPRMSEPASASTVRRVHVLDTAAVYHLANNHRPPLWRELVVPGQSVFIPAVVLLEAEQSEPIARKRLEAIEDYSEVDDRLPRRLLERASESLRAVHREKCRECGGFPRPSLVDAVVVVYAANIADGDPDVAVDVHTDDVADLTHVAQALGAVSARINVRKCV